MSNGYIVEPGFDIDVWNGTINLPGVVLEDKTPRGLYGTQYLWSNFRAKPSLITTQTTYNAYMAEQMVSILPSYVGQYVNVYLYQFGKDKRYLWLIKSLEVSTKRVISTQSDSHTLLSVRWEVEAQEVSE